MMRSFVRARQGMLTRIFPHQGNEDFMKGARAPQAAPSAMLPAAGALPAATVGTPYSLQLTVSGGTPVHFVVASYGLSAGFPSGLSVSDSGLISGTPGVPAGAYSATIRAFNRNGMTQNLYTLQVNP
jgi:hypothetical protein